MSTLPLTARFLRFMLRHNIRGQHRLVFSIARRLPSLHAVPITFADRSPVYVDLRSASGWEWLKGSPWSSVPDEEYEQQLIKKIIQITDVVYDIGANIGLYTTLLARLAGQVVAFEPNHDLLRTLLVTTAGLRNVKVLPVALSDTTGIGTLYVPNDHTMGSLANYTQAESLTDWKQNIGLSEAESMDCKTVTLDSLIAEGLPAADFIKCDVEGAELKVFKGGRALLSCADPPIVLFEVLEMCSDGFGVDKFAAADFLSERAYQLFDVGPNGSLSPMKPRDQKSNVLAVPPSRLSRIANYVS